jgi:hypothetical protein
MALDDVRCCPQQAKPVIEPCGDLLDRQDVDTRTCQLNRQRQAVQMAANAGDHCRVLRGQCKVGQDRPGALDE